MRILLPRVKGLTPLPKEEIQKIDAVVFGSGKVDQISILEDGKIITFRREQEL